MKKIRNLLFASGIRSNGDDLFSYINLLILVLYRKNVLFNSYFCWLYLDINMEYGKVKIIIIYISLVLKLFKFRFY